MSELHPQVLPHRLLQKSRRYLLPHNSLFFIIAFNGDEIEDYLNNVKKVTLDNNVELKSGGIYDDSTKTFKIGTESSSGAKSYLDFSKDCFTKVTLP